MDNRLYRAAIIGCGWRGGEHAQTYAIVPEGELVAYADISADRLKAFEEFVPPSAIACSSIEELRRTELHVLHITTPPSARLDLVTAAIEMNVQALIVEKPLALGRDEATAIVDACEKADVLLVVNHQHRNLSENRTIVDAIMSGRLGKVEHVLASTHADFFEQGTHMLDSASQFFDDDLRPTAVFAQVEFDQEDRKESPELEPRQLTATIELEDDRRITIECGSYSYPVPGPSEWYFRMRSDVLCTEGRAVALVNTGCRIWSTANGYETVPADWDEEVLPSEALLIRSVLDTLSGKRPPPPVSGRANLQPFELYDAIVVSAAEHRRVTLPVDNDAARLGRALQHLHQ